MLRIRLNINEEYQTDGSSASKKIILSLIKRKISIEVIAKRIGVKRYEVVDLINGNTINPNVAVLNRLLKFHMEISKHGDIDQVSKQINTTGGGYAH